VGKIVSVEKKFKMQQLQINGLLFLVEHLMVEIEEIKRKVKHKK
jgi:hypothetical protein